MKSKKRFTLVCSLFLISLSFLPQKMLAGSSDWYLKTNTGDTVAVEDIGGISWGGKFEWNPSSFSSDADYVYDETEHDETVTITGKFGEIKDVRSFSFFKKVPTAIKEVSGRNNCLHLNATESSITLKNTTAGKKIIITSISGIVMKSVISADEETIIDSSNLTPSVYLLSIDGNIIKFIKK